MILIDTNIFMYAAGKESPQRLPCQQFLERIVEGEGPLACTDTEVLQEILHRYRALKIPEVGFRLFDAVTHLGIPILAVTDRAMAHARKLLEDYPALSTRDGVHLGVMQEHGIEEVLTYDGGFSEVPWAKRLEA
ncbi:MAG TPA: type II toxin-antitoxin system VapC family toxin [Thermoanaerobaculia bacterium]|nr:type II toxin-antitoxin system VapC family toxin [Thermoanaerobaculia bacterium]